MSVTNRRHMWAKTNLTFKFWHIERCLRCWAKAMYREHVIGRNVCSSYICRYIYIVVLWSHASASLDWLWSCDWPSDHAILLLDHQASEWRVRWLVPWSLAVVLEFSTMGPVVGAMAMVQAERSTLANSWWTWLWWLCSWRWYIDGQMEMDSSRTWTLGSWRSWAWTSNIRWWLWCLG